MNFEINSWFYIFLGYFIYDIIFEYLNKKKHQKEIQYKLDEYHKMLAILDDTRKDLININDLYEDTKAELQEHKSNENKKQEYIKNMIKIN